MTASRRAQAAMPGRRYSAGRSHRPASLVSGVADTPCASIEAVTTRLTTGQTSSTPVRSFASSA